MTQRMGESSIELKVWLQIINILEMYPFNCQSVSLYLCFQYKKLFLVITLGYT